MQRIFKQIDANIERWALLVFYVLLVLTMSVEVIRREVFSYSSIWGEEIVRYSFIYLAWIGAASAVKERAHIRIDVLLHYVSSRTKTLLYILGDLVMFVVACFALFWSYETFAVAWKFGAVSHGLRVPMVWFLFAVPAGFSLILFRLIQSFLRDFRDLRAGGDVFEGNKMFD
jgi:TRAP-type C4-dicarboxylate transport system permease small subunit